MTESKKMLDIIHNNYKQRRLERLNKEELDKIKQRQNKANKKEFMLEILCLIVSIATLITFIVMEVIK